MKKPRAKHEGEGVKLSPGAVRARVQFEEAKHRRGFGGKFTEMGGGEGAKKGPGRSKGAQPGAASAGADKAEWQAAAKSSGVQGTDQIKLHVTSNPKKAGSASADRFAKYQDGMTADEFIAAGGTREDLAWDRKKGFITIHDPPTYSKLSGAPGSATAEINAVGTSGRLQDIKGSVEKPPASVAEAAQQPHTPPKQPAEAKAAKVEKPKETPKPKAAHGLEDDDILSAAADPEAKMTVGEVRKDFKKQGATDEQIDHWIKANIDNGKMVATKTAPKKFEEPEPAKALASKKEGTEPEKKNMSGTIKDKAENPEGEAAPAQKPIIRDKNGTEVPEDTIVKYGFDDKITLGEYRDSLIGKNLGTHTPESLIALQLSNGDLKVVKKSKQVVKPLEAEPGAKYAPDDTITAFGDKMTVYTWKNNFAPHMTTEQAEAFLDSKVAAGQFKITKATKAEKAAIAKDAADIAARKAQAEADNKLHYELIQKPEFAAEKARWDKAVITNPMKDGDTPEGFNKSMESVRKKMGMTFVSGQKSEGVAHYSEEGNVTINSTLREKTYNDLNAYDKKSTDELDKLIAGSKTKVDGVMWRGVKSYEDTDNLNNMPPPSEFTDLGFTSMSFNPHISHDFAGQSTRGGGETDTIFKIRVPAGTNALHISNEQNVTIKDSLIDGEAEALVARGTRFRYVSTSKAGVKIDNTTYDVIELEIVRDDGGKVIEVK